MFLTMYLRTTFCIFLLLCKRRASRLTVTRTLIMKTGIDLRFRVIIAVRNKTNLFLIPVVASKLVSSLNKVILGWRY